MSPTERSEQRRALADRPSTETTGIAPGEEVAGSSRGQDARRYGLRLGTLRWFDQAGRVTGNHRGAGCRDRLVTASASGESGGRALGGEAKGRTYCPPVTGGEFEFGKVPSVV